MKDRRQDIINASLAVLKASGYAGFTQPRVAAEVGLRQSHLTYYFPTRVDLLAAVARVAIDRQLVAVDSILATASVREAAKAIANVAVRHENTRVIMALVQAADHRRPSFSPISLSPSSTPMLRLHFFMQALPLSLRIFSTRC